MTRMRGLQAGVGELESSGAAEPEVFNDFTRSFEENRPASWGKMARRQLNFRRRNIDCTMPCESSSRTSFEVAPCPPCQIRLPPRPKPATEPALPSHGITVYS